VKPWEVWDYEFPFGVHPAIIVSHSRRVELKPDIVVLKCSSQRATREAVGLEAIVDEADGLDWKTIVQCDVFFTVAKVRLRRRDIVRKMRAGFELAGL
jgi:hypothetical protein